MDQAYAERRPASRPALPRLAVALAIAALLAALQLSPAGHPCAGGSTTSSPPASATPSRL